jgi:hypothetical protein
MKIFYAVVFIVFTAAELSVILQLKRRRQKTGARAVGTGFVLIMLLTLAVYLFDLRVSYFVMLLAVVDLFLDAYAGYYLDYYTTSRVVDRWLHGYGSLAMALLFYNVITLIIEEGGSKVFRALFILCLGIALGAVHEIFEYISDRRYHSQMQKGLKDTNLDNIFNVAGAAAAAVSAYVFML